MSIEVIKSGAQTSVQDAGRHGFLNTGLSPAGPLDHLSLRVASLLVGNELPAPLFAKGPRGDAGLEITLLGPTLRFTQEALIAVAGADFPVKIDGRDMPMYEALHVGPGQVLEFGQARSGARCYLAVAGGINVAPVLGSRSENLFASRGPLGRALRVGDVLPLQRLDRLTDRRAGLRFDVSKLAPVPQEPVLRVVLGPQDALFTDASLEDFQAQPWTMGTQANRTGMRFKGPLLKFKSRPEYLARDAGPDPSNIVDDVIPVGGIQCPSGIEAIVMGTENPTVGGFAKVATVISSDIAVLGQLRPGQSVRFKSVSVLQAITIARETTAIASTQNLIGRGRL